MPPSPRTRWNLWLRSLAATERMRPLFETVMHPSAWRIRALGLSTAIGHPLFHLIWTHWLPQPYEILWHRLVMSALGLALLMAPSLRIQPPTRGATILFTSIFWITLPLYFTWMYLCNGLSTVWLASMSAMFVIYYHLTDWRIATLGLLVGLPLAWVLFRHFGVPLAPPAPREVATHAVVLGFSWYMGLMLGLSSSNLRRLQLRQALATIGIIAHELRTPLSTISLIGEAIRHEAREAPAPGGERLEQLSVRLHAMVRNMNQQIDMQIANARLLNLPAAQAQISAAQVVRHAVAGFPFRTARERECVQAHVVHDFTFHSAEALFTQVISNLLKNALRALAAMPMPPRAGDLRIEVRLAGRRGRITVADRGAGMSQDLRARLFQPFVSTQAGTGHGLGLAFCQRVVQEARGTIRVESELGHGARFIIDLPLAQRPHAGTA